MKNRFFRLTAIAVFLSAPLFADPPEGYNQAIEHYNAGRFDKSLEVIRGIFEANKNSYEVRMLAAANHANLRNYDAAIQHMQYCIKDHPEKVEAKVLFASILRKSGHFYDAIRVARSVLDAGTENLPLRMELARSLYRVGQYAPARQQVEKILQSQSNNYDAIALDGLIFLRQGNLENAEFRLSNALTLTPGDNPDRQHILNNLGFVLEKTGDRYLAQGDKQHSVASYREAQKRYNEAKNAGPVLELINRNLERIAQKLK